MEGMFFLYDGGDELDLFIGQKCLPERIEALLGNASSPVDRFVMLVDRKNDLSSRVVALARQLLGIKDSSVGVAVNLFGLGDPSDMKSLAKLVEDKIFAEQAYHSFLVQLYTVLQSGGISS